MDRSYKVLPVYSGDVSGAASALYELGGMMVIHDPSGCNSTYNTHDEVRWNEIESLIFISGLTDTDAITGNDEKFIKDIVEAALLFKPNFISIANSPIPYINGTDFNYIAKEVTKRSNVKTYPIATNAFHDYTVGAANAFKMVAEELVDDKDEKHICREKGNNEIKINILGTTPLDFTTRDSMKSLKDICKKAGFNIISNWGFESRFEEIKNAGCADVNLVVSSCGLKAAKVLKERFNIPFIIGCPIGKYGDVLINKIISDCNIINNENEDVEIENISNENIGDTDNIIIGETVISKSLARAIKLENGHDFKVCATTEMGSEILDGCDALCLGEEAVEKYIKNAKRIIADPMYKKIAPHGAEFIELPHFAFSGRMYLGDMKNIFEMSVDI